MTDDLDTAIAELRHQLDELTQHSVDIRKLLDAIATFYNLKEKP